MEENAAMLPKLKESCNVTEEQLRNILFGEFIEIEVGDYFLINDVKYVVVQNNKPEDCDELCNMVLIPDKAVNIND